LGPGDDLLAVIGQARRCGRVRVAPLVNALVACELVGHGEAAGKSEPGAEIFLLHLLALQPRRSQRGPTEKPANIAELTDHRQQGRHPAPNRSTITSEGW